MCISLGPFISHFSIYILYYYSFCTRKKKEEEKGLFANNTRGQQEYGGRIGSEGRLNGMHGADFI